MPKTDASRRKERHAYANEAIARRGWTFGYDSSRWLLCNYTFNTIDSISRIVSEIGTTYTSIILVITG